MSLYYFKKFLAILVPWPFLINFVVGILLSNSVIDVIFHYIFLYISGFCEERQLNAYTGSEF